MWVGVRGDEQPKKEGVVLLVCVRKMCVMRYWTIKKVFFLVLPAAWFLLVVWLIRFPNHTAAQQMLHHDLSKKAATSDTIVLFVFSGTRAPYVVCRLSEISVTVGLYYLYVNFGSAALSRYSSEHTQHDSEQMETACNTVDARIQHPSFDNVNSHVLEFHGSTGYTSPTGSSSFCTSSAVALLCTCKGGKNKNQRLIKFFVPFLRVVSRQPSHLSRTRSLC